MTWFTRDDHKDSLGYPQRSTFGSQGVIGARFGQAYPSGKVVLFDHRLVARHIKCRSYRRAVRVLRWHLMGYNV